MACFSVPLAGAAVAAATSHVAGKRSRNPFIAKLDWLAKMGLGGSLLLAVEHVFHGEMVPYPPFLTAMKSPEDTQEMLHEICTVGVSMAVLLVVVWMGMVVVSEAVARRKAAVHV